MILISKRTVHFSASNKQTNYEVFYWSIHGLFLFIFFFQQLACSFYNFADDRIRTADFWYRKQLPANLAITTSQQTSLKFDRISHERFSAKQFTRNQFVLKFWTLQKVSKNCNCRVH